VKITGSLATANAKNRKKTEKARNIFQVFSERRRFFRKFFNASSLTIETDSASKLGY
jgi:hypothetical protein